MFEFIYFLNVFIDTFTFANFVPNIFSACHIEIKLNFHPNTDKISAPDT